MLYIFWSLHQTTTNKLYVILQVCCISFDPYIKPQRFLLAGYMLVCCISFDPYIKPQPPEAWGFPQAVVYLLIPTSNHNLFHAKERLSLLYIFWSLHQTTTWLAFCLCLNGCISFDPYIKPQHKGKRSQRSGSCISFDPYIKPQLSAQIFLLP